MKKTLKFLTSLTIFAVTGCCTMMEKGSYDIPVESSVPGTNVKVYAGIVNHKGHVTRGSGELVAALQTPGTVTVASQKSDVYTFAFEKEGYAPRTEYRVAEVSKYIKGNIVWLIGCPIGLIVDSQTGANRTFSEAPVRAEMLNQSSRNTLGHGIQAGGIEAQGVTR